MKIDNPEITYGTSDIGMSGITVTDFLITTTSETSVATLTPRADGNFLIGIHFNVITSTINVTITVTWTDSVGAQTNTLLSVQSTPIGNYACLPLFISAKTTGGITVKATASSANKLYVSTTIKES